MAKNTMKSSDPSRAREGAVGSMGIKPLPVPPGEALRGRRRCATPGRGSVRFRSVRLPIVGLLATAVFATTGYAQTVRIWPTAVVTEQQVTLADVCDLSPLDGALRERLAATVVATAPVPGGSTSLNSADVQKALQAAGLNPATLLLTGATCCTVLRPQLPETATQGMVTAGHPSLHRLEAPATLRDAVRRAFEQHLARFGGRVQIEFSRAPRQVLDLAEPECCFNVRVSGERWLGALINVDVDVECAGRRQTAHLAVNASLIKSVVVARRPINQKATIRPEDVHVVERTIDDVAKVSEATLPNVLGQRAKQFLPADRPIDPADLEVTPLVHRGQIVQVLSRVGAVEIWSAAKANDSGAMGEVIELRTSERRGERLLATVIGERRVRIQEGEATTLVARTDVDGGVSR